MKAAVITGFVLAGFLATRADAQAPEPGKVIGRWSGSGSLFDTTLAKRVGPIPIALTMESDQSGAGQLGNASLTVTRFTAGRGLIEVRADLSGAPAADRALAKRRLVLLVTSATDSTLHAEFHLKSNFIFDPTMREGRVLLTRVR